MGEIIMHPCLKAALAGTAAFSAALAAADAAVLVTNKAGFLSTTGATSATGPIPIVAGGLTSYTVGSTTFSAENPSTLNFTQDWTNRIAGNQFAVNGDEDINADFGGDVFSFGFDFVEPENDPLVNAPFVDSTFEISLCDGGSCFDSVQFNAPNDAAAFIGVISSLAFDSVIIRELVGGVENEFFGEFYTSTEPVSDVPLPAAAPLFLAGLTGAGFAFRRKRGN
ncbi:hypothetical protein CW354_08910 [Marinicaulis flavus]|uniref:Ice-binding protein C-terminal domain-containing protein n=2 Tax=Hyphococcus luteus TaxID=2058213 RepID=A0A2S7K7B8_9PROT|nr:hypothetical protein CW354_08910 [Marinicaulis flavus]